MHMHYEQLFPYVSNGGLCVLFGLTEHSRLNLPELTHNKGKHITIKNIKVCKKKTPV